MAKVLALVGGISQGSINKKLFKTVRSLAPKGLEFDAFEIEKLPFFSQDLESDLPAIVRDFKDRIKSADAILFVTPEYNRSFPGVLKNAVDWGSRPEGQNSWAEKPCALIGGSSGNIGTALAQSHLRQTLVHLNMRTMAQPEVYLNLSKAFDADGNMSDERTKGFLQKFVTTFEAWIAKAR